MKEKTKDKIWVGMCCGVASTVLYFAGSFMYKDIKKQNKKVDERYLASQQTIEATVLEDNYRIELRNNSRRQHIGFFGSAKIKEVVVDPRYSLKIRTSDGRLMGLSVIEGGGVSLDSLDMLIEPGSKISFPRGNWISRSYTDRRESYVGLDSQTATKRSDRIRVH